MAIKVQAHGRKSEAYGSNIEAPGRKSEAQWRKSEGPECGVESGPHARPWHVSSARKPVQGSGFRVQGSGCNM